LKLKGRLTNEKKGNMDCSKFACSAGHAHRQLRLCPRGSPGTGTNHNGTNGKAVTGTNHNGTNSKAITSTIAGTHTETHCPETYG
jgi:hypothetical protein